jgi:hypothetical protein
MNPHLVAVDELVRPESSRGSFGMTASTPYPQIAYTGTLPTNVASALAQNYHVVVRRRLLPQLGSEEQLFGELRRDDNEHRQHP